MFGYPQREGRLGFISTSLTANGDGTNGVIKAHDAYDYDAEKRQALEKWPRRLSGIISGEKEEKVA